MEFTPRQREVLNLIAQGDEIILNIASETVRELRLNGFVCRHYSNQAFVYEVTAKGYEILASTDEVKVNIKEKGNEIYT